MKSVKAERVILQKPDDIGFCKDCRNRIAKRCRIIGIYVPRKGGCNEFVRRMK